MPVRERYDLADAGAHRRAVPDHTAECDLAQMRLALFAAMAGFLTMAMAIPEVFGAGALTFGLSYLFVVALHLGAFAFKGEGGAARAIFGIAPFNLAASALLIGAAFVDARWASPSSRSSGSLNPQGLSTIDPGTSPRAYNPLIPGSIPGGRALQSGSGRAGEVHPA